MKRKIYDQLLLWKNKRKGKYTKDLSKDGALQMVPVYMAPFL